jgi:hypothetical protein
MNSELRRLVEHLETRPPADVRPLEDAAAQAGVELPQDYLEFMATTNGAAGDIGSTWVEFWPVHEILRAAGDSPYEGVFLVAGDGANTIYGFDVRANNEIVEGDWIGLSREQLIRHGPNFTNFLARMASGG